MPNRDGSGPLGDGRPGRGFGNCSTSRKTGLVPGSAKISSSRGYANIGITLFVDAIRYMINKQSKKGVRNAQK